MHNFRRKIFCFITSFVFTLAALSVTANEELVAIDHNGLVIMVSPSAVAAHLAHGDDLACDPNEPPGC